MRWRLLSSALAALLLCVPTAARSVPSCGGLEDTCPCGGSNPYPCCENNGNCTWYAWHAACCNLGVALPPWGNANTWAGYAASHPEFEVKTTPAVSCVGNRVTPQYPGDEWGHVAWVEAVGASVKVTHQGCWSFSGVQTAWYALDFFDKFICLAGGGGPIGPACGDGACDGGETCGSCPDDCGTCCGDGICGGGETCQSCEVDCGPCCGNNACDAGETCQSCEADCGPCCGNGVCGDGGETCASCEADCGPCCGNGVCDGAVSEHCFSCAQDCGPCCGNGACDWGENCDSCVADCGGCVQAPQGYLEAATCASVEGWALDPDAQGPLTVELLVDGAAVATALAALPTPAHGDCGFSAPWPEAFKDGSAHLVEVRAWADGDGGGAALLPGSGRWVRCGSGEATRGIWRVTHIDAGGLGIDLAPTFEPGSALGLVHPGDLAYPPTGVVEARTVLGSDPLDEVRFHVDGAFDPQRYAVELLAGEVAEPIGAEGDRSWIPGTEGEIGVRVRTLDPTPDPAHRFVEISGLAARTGGWWNLYSYDAAGVTWGHGAPDRVAFEIRPGAEWVRGSAASWHLFEEPFDGVSFSVDQDLVAGLAGQLLVDGALVVQIGPSFLQPEVDLAVIGQELRFRFLSQPGVAVSGDVGLRLDDIRVHRSRTEGLFPWQVSWSRAWDLTASLPDAQRPGLAVRLVASSGDGWFATGTLEARTQVAEGPALDVPAFDRVRGLLSWELAPGFEGQLRVNGEAVEELSAESGAGVPFDLAAAGWFFSAWLGVDPAAPGVGESWIEVEGLSFHRGGWWTTAENATRGITDGRTGTCGIRVQAQPGWGEAGLAAEGSLWIHRDFAEPVSGVRYRRDGGAAGTSLSLVVDGLDVEVIPDPTGLAEGSWSGAAREIGFRVVVAEPQVFDSPWSLEVTSIEVRVDGAWRSACDHPEADGWEPGCRDAACAPDAPGTDRGGQGSCGIGGGATGPWWMFLVLLGIARRYTGRR